MPMTEGAIRKHLEKIIASRPFHQSARISRFLRFAVEHTLERPSESLKEYVLGLEVFDRKAAYDPKQDPIVRVEARRLRAMLRAYYDGEGRHDPVLIEFPKGGYVPVFQEGPADSSERNQNVQKTTVVLPFTNLSGDPENEHFGDGLTQELIHALTKIEGLSVVAWNSAMQLKSASYDIRAIGQQLKVGTALVGSVRKAGEHVRIAVQLVDTITGVYLWSETFDQKMEDLLAIQVEIAIAVANALRLRLGCTSASQFTPRSARNIEAYNLYLKGRFHWGKRTAEGLRKGGEYFEEALAIDPACSVAYAGLADAHTLLAEYGLSRPEQAMPKARSAALRALELDPLLAEAHTSLASIRSMYDWEWPEAELHYLRALELNPGYCTAHHWFAVDHLALRGRLDQALAEIEIARQLDPLSPILVEGKGMILMFERQYDEAMAAYQQSLDLDPYFYKGYTAVGRVYFLKGMYDLAIELFLKGRSLAGEIPNIIGALGQTYGMLGRTREARQALEDLTCLAERAYVPSTCFAVIHLGLGEKERALEWLETGCNLRELPMSTLKIQPVYDPLRGDPRFECLIKRMRLAD